MSPRLPAAQTVTARVARRLDGVARGVHLRIRWIAGGALVVALIVQLSGGRPAGPNQEPGVPAETPEILGIRPGASGVNLPGPGGTLGPRMARRFIMAGPEEESSAGLSGEGDDGPEPAALGEAQEDDAPGETPEDTPAELAAAFADSDPEAGLAWAGLLPTLEEREMAWENLAWGCAGRNRAVTIEALEQLPPGEPRWRLAAHIASQWAVEHLDDAERWAGSRSNPFERDAALAAVAIGVAEVQPVRAATLVARDLPAGPARDHAVVAVVQRWVQSDPAGAEGWVAAFTDRPLRAAARAAILGTVPPEAQAP